MMETRNRQKHFLPAAMKIFLLAFFGLQSTHIHKASGEQFRKWPSLTLIDNVLGNRTQQLIERYPYFVNQTTGKITLVRDYSNGYNVYMPSKEYLESTNIENVLYDMEKNIYFESRYRLDRSYSDENDLIKSAYPVSDQQSCHEHLKWLKFQLSDASQLFDRGVHSTKLMHYLDTFGRPEQKTYDGNTYWLGSYEGCQSIEFDMSKYPPSDSVDDRKLSGSKFRTRYCLAKLRLKSWPKNDTFFPKPSIKAAICLPETCDSRSIENQSSIIDHLLRINFAQIHNDRYELMNEMYCLPDERSPLRQFTPATKIFLFLNTVWLGVVILATIGLEITKKYNTSPDISNFSKKTKISADKNDDSRPSIATRSSNNAKIQVLGQASTDWKRETRDATAQKCIDGEIGQANQSLVCETNQQSNVLKRQENNNRRLTNTRAMEKFLKALSIIENFKRLTRSNVTKTIEYKQKNTREVNLRPMNSIKVLATFIIVYAHILYMAGLNFKTTRNFIYYYVFDIWIMLGASASFTVESFFIIGGMLMAYGSMKYLTAHARPLETLLNIRNWIMLFFMRLARLAPMFMLVFCYCKLVAVYTSKGPAWDYGTNVDSMRGRCINSEWFRVGVLFSNVGLNSYPSCNEPSWFVPVYMHFVLASPLILYLFARFSRIRFGMLALMLFLSAVHQYDSFFKQTAYHIEYYMKCFWPANYIQEKYSSRPYTNSLDRIGVASTGILGGYFLERYESGKLKDWPWWMRGTSLKLMSFVLFLVTFSPVGSLLFRYEVHGLGPHLPLAQYFANFLHPFTYTTFVICNTIILLRITTDLNKTTTIGRLLSKPWWTIINKLTYCVYLIHYEVIIYMYTASTEYVDITWYRLLTDTVIAWVISFSISLPLYVLYESPLNGLIGICLGKK